MTSHIASPNVQKRVSFGLTDDQLIEALKDIFTHYGYDLAALTVAAKQEIANRLSEVAGRAEPWEWRYVHNFMMHNVKAGQQFKAAIAGLAAMIDGTPIQLIKGRTVAVTALGNITPGAIVYGDSQKCANIACPVHFVPRVWNQKYCSPACNPRHKKKART